MAAVVAVAASTHIVYCHKIHVIVVELVVVATDPCTDQSVVWDGDSMIPHTSRTGNLTVAVVAAADRETDMGNAAAVLMTDDAEVRTEPGEAAVVRDSRCMTAGVESVSEHILWTGICRKMDVAAVSDDVEIDETDSGMTCKDAVVEDEISIRCQEDQLTG